MTSGKDECGRKGKGEWGACGKRVRACVRACVRVSVCVRARVCACVKKGAMKVLIRGILEFDAKRFLKL